MSTASRNSGKARDGKESASYAPHVPLSERRAAALDMRTVELPTRKKGLKEEKRARPHHLREAPTYRPTEEEFRDPYAYIRQIRSEAEKFGICKIIPPDSWRPSFAVDTERFFFKTRRQELNSVEGGTRTQIQYLDQLAKFHQQNGTTLSKFPTVDKKPLDFFKLKRTVDAKGGYESVCKGKKWAEVGRSLDYSGKIMSSLSSSLKNSYQKWLLPYEEYLQMAKNTNARPRPDSPTSSLSSPLSEPNFDETMSQSRHEGRHTDAPSKEPNRKKIGPASSSLPNGEQKSPHDESSQISTASAGEAPNFTSYAFFNKALANPLKRPLTPEVSSKSSVEDRRTSIDDPAENSSRRSKRAKRSSLALGKQDYDDNDEEPEIGHGDSKLLSKDYHGGLCIMCGKSCSRSQYVSCGECGNDFHHACLDFSAGKGSMKDWQCPKCLAGTGEFGFEDGGIYSLSQFQKKANQFHQSYFGKRKGVPNGQPVHVSAEEIEQEFWRLVASPNEEVEVEYGADIHSTTHGSGFSILEKSPDDAYAANYWNLNVLPFHPDSLFKHINADISGMTIPWLYVGMCFSTFCWHNEDHYSYSANYQHFGATKTWYGIPGADAKRFETAMKEAVPELFESQPDLLFQLVTLLPPDRLAKVGVNVFALDQNAGQFVITFPQAYHAGFNHGFNFNEAVNFAPEDWEPFGAAGVQRLQDFHKQPCFSHDELLMNAAEKDVSIKSAQWLAPALERMYKRERDQRRHMVQRRKSFEHSDSKSDVATIDDDLPSNNALQGNCSAAAELEHQCACCKTYNYLSSYKCKKSNKVMCLIHAGNFECCEAPLPSRCSDDQHIFQSRISLHDLAAVHQRIQDRANQPQAWQDKLDQILDGHAAPSLRSLRALVHEGERIAWPLPGLVDLKEFCNKCSEWVEEAQNYLTRKQQNRRKNDRVWRKSKDAAKLHELDEKEKDIRRFENIQRLLIEARDLSFDCPEVNALTERAQAIEDFRSKAKHTMEGETQQSASALRALIENGREFNIDIPEIEELERFSKYQEWLDEARGYRAPDGNDFQSLAELDAFICKGVSAGAPETNEQLSHLRQLHTTGTEWEMKASEALKMEPVKHSELETLLSHAQRLPVSPNTIAAIDALLNKQRNVQRRIGAMFEQSKDSDFRRRPRYKDVREALDELAQSNSRPVGASDLEAACKRHESWMRVGKKLFGKANAPLYILHSHMVYVVEHNTPCFDLNDKPRMPVEPASRHITPAEAEEVEGIKSDKNVFCMCRRPEAGTMLECELCLEWYHSRCLKVARGKVKDKDKYNCPICDWRVKIPRDAARPKLEDLIDWRHAIPDLPFQPEEEETLDCIISQAQRFRDFLRPYMNPMMTNPDEVTSQRFYLRKLEGAEVLLAYETNFFRQEVHKWAPVTAEPPPVLEESRSTRKPRPTKQQKLMQQFGVTDPEDLPLEVRSRGAGRGRKPANGIPKALPTFSSRPPQPHPQSQANPESLARQKSQAIMPHDTSGSKSQIRPANTPVEDGSGHASIQLPKTHSFHHRDPPSPPNVYGRDVNRAYVIPDEAAQSSNETRPLNFEQQYPAPEAVRPYSPSAVADQLSLSGPSPYFTQSSDMDPSMGFSAPGPYPAAKARLGNHNGGADYYDDAPLDEYPSPGGTFAGATMANRSSMRNAFDDSYHAPREDGEADVFSEFLAPYGADHDTQDVHGDLEESPEDHFSGVNVQG